VALRQVDPTVDDAPTGPSSTEKIAHQAPLNLAPIARHPGRSLTTPGQRVCVSLPTHT